MSGITGTKDLDLIILSFRSQFNLLIIIFSLKYNYLINFLLKNWMKFCHS